MPRLIACLLSLLTTLTPISALHAQTNQIPFSTGSHKRFPIPGAESVKPGDGLDLSRLPAVSIPHKVYVKDSVYEKQKPSQDEKGVAGKGQKEVTPQTGLKIDYIGFDQSSMTSNSFTLLAQFESLFGSAELSIANLQRQLQRTVFLYILVEHVVDSRELADNALQFDPQNKHLMSILAEKDPSDRFRRFINTVGTHYVQRVHLGSRVVIRVTADTSQFSSAASVKAKVSVNFGPTASGKVEMSQEQKREYESKSINFNVIQSGTFKIDNRDWLVKDIEGVFNLLNAMQNKVPLVAKEPLYVDLLPMGDILIDQFADLRRQLTGGYAPLTIAERVTNLEEKKSRSYLVFKSEEYWFSADKAKPDDSVHRTIDFGDDVVVESAIPVVSDLHISYPEGDKTLDFSLDVKNIKPEGGKVHFDHLMYFGHAKAGQWAKDAHAKITVLALVRPKAK